MNVPKLSEIMDAAELLFDREELEDAIEDIADAIHPDYADDEQPPLFVTVMHGGLPFAGQLAFALGERGLDVEFDYLHATRYRGATTGSRLAGCTARPRRCAGAGCCWSTTSSTRATRSRR